MCETSFYVRKINPFLGMFLPSGGYEEVIGYKISAHPSKDHTRCIWSEQFQKTNDINKMKQLVEDATKQCKHHIDIYAERTTREDDLNNTLNETVKRCVLNINDNFKKEDEYCDSENYQSLQYARGVRDPEDEE